MSVLGRAWHGRWLGPNVVAGSLLMGCASRSLPVSYPENAASSAQAPEVKPAQVTLALTGELPAPAASSTPAPSEHDHMHHHMDHSQHQGHAHETP